jgi:hypothetical protein
MGDEYRYIHFFSKDGSCNHGGYTIVVNMTRRTLGIAVCSAKDQYGRKKGIRLAKHRIATMFVSSPLTTGLVPTEAILTTARIIAPRIHSEGVSASLQRAAIRRAINYALTCFGDLTCVLTVLE